MDLVTLPVVNGLLPKAYDGLVNGIVADAYTVRMLESVKGDTQVFLAPYAHDDRNLFTVGVLGRVDALWVGEVYVGMPPEKTAALFAIVRGIGRAQAAGFSLKGRAVIAEGVNEIDLGKMRDEGYPAICGGGWLAEGGVTDQTPWGDVDVTIQGKTLFDGSKVKLKAKLRDLVSPYQAHTIEHGIIRSLGQYGLCSPRTLVRAIRNESRELRSSVELGYQLEMPEIFGVTQSGMCGNPLTNLARFFLVRDLVERLREGESVVESLGTARKKALSQLSTVLDVNTGEGLRVVHGLHRGMRHDDTPLTVGLLTKVLDRFPPDPWS